MCRYTLAFDWGKRLERLTAQQVADALTYEALSNGGVSAIVRACRTDGRAKSVALQYVGPGGDYLAAFTDLPQTSPIVVHLAQALFEANSEMGY